MESIKGHSYPQIVAAKDLQLLIALLLTGAVFAFGRFAFFDLLGLKREVEGALLILTTLFLPLILLRYRTYWKDSVFWLALVFLISELLRRGDMLVAGNSLISVLLVASLLSLRKEGKEFCLKTAIIVSGIFAIMGLIEWCILLGLPQLIDQVALDYADYSASSHMHLNHPLALLGMTSGEEYRFLGFDVSRLRSFTTEPSHIAAYFMLPGALALTYRGHFRWWGLPLLTFTLLSFSGSGFLAFAMSVVSAFVLRVAKRAPWIGMWFPILFLTLSFSFLVSGGIDKILSYVSLLADVSHDNFSFLEKYHSTAAHLGHMVDVLSNVKMFLFGSPQPVDLQLGFPLYGILAGGIPGLVISFIILNKIFKSISTINLKDSLPGTVSLGLFLLYGFYLQVAFFNCLILVSGAGFLFFTLSLYRLQDLSSQYTSTG